MLIVLFCVMCAVNISIAIIGKLKLTICVDDIKMMIIWKSVFEAQYVIYRLSKCSNDLLERSLLVSTTPCKYMSAKDLCGIWRSTLNIYSWKYMLNGTLVIVFLKDIGMKRAFLCFLRLFISSCINVKENALSK